MTSLISMKLISILRHMKSPLAQTYFAHLVAATTVQVVFLRRACFLVAYFSVAAWLVVQYGKRLGLPEIYSIYKYQVSIRIAVLFVTYVQLNGCMLYRMCITGKVAPS